VLSGAALQRIEQSAIRKMIVTDSILQDDRGLPSTFEVVTVSELIGEAINRIFDEESVSSLFREMPSN